MPKADLCKLCSFQEPFPGFVKCKGDVMIKATKAGVKDHDLQNLYLATWHNGQGDQHWSAQAKPTTKASSDIQLTATLALLIRSGPGSGGSSSASTCFGGSTATWLSSPDTS